MAKAGMPLKKIINKKPTESQKDIRDPAKYLFDEEIGEEYEKNFNSYYPSSQKALKMDLPPEKIESFDKFVSNSQLNDPYISSLEEKTTNLAPIIKRRLEAKKLDKKLEGYKEKHLDIYFKERIKLTNAYLGEDLLKSQRATSNKDGNIQSGIQNFVEEESDLKEFLHYLKGEEGASLPAAKKMLQINREIKAELMKDKHERKMKLLKDLKQQHNREMFKFLNDPKEKVTRIKVRSPRQEMINNFTVESKMMKSKSIKSRREMKNYFPNADPNKTPENGGISRPQTQQMLRRQVSPKKSDDGEKNKEEFISSFYQNHFFSRNKIPVKAIRSASAFKNELKELNERENSGNQFGGAITSKRNFESSKGFSGQGTRPQTKAESSSGRDWGFKPVVDDSNGFAGLLKRKNKPSIHEYSSGGDWKNYS